MEWLIYQKTATGGLRPVYGVLSQFGGGAVIYAGLALVIVYLLWLGLREGRRGEKWYLLLSLYAVMLLLMVALAMVMHARPRGSPEFRSARVHLTIAGMFLIVGGPPLIYMVFRDSIKRLRARRNGSTPS